MVDLSELTFLDCSGLNVFLAARHRAAANGHRLILFGARRTAWRVFELTGADRMFDEQEAVTALGQFYLGIPGAGDTVTNVP